MKLTKLICRTALGLVIALPLFANAEEAEVTKSGGRAMVMEIEAVVTDIDLETRQVSLQGPMGNTVTLTATEQVVKLEDISVGDTLVATYLASLEGELREPTEEELAEPWVVLEDAGISEGDEQPTVAGARVIRAVCTVEGMNRLLGTVTVLDPRGKAHVISEVEPEKMSGVTLGQTIVLVYSEALAMTLEPVVE